jgi:hypothetical protein
MSKARDIADLGAVTSRLDTVGASDGALSNRNMIINGAMQVAQRGTSATLTSGNFTVDRFKLQSTNLDELAGTMTQDSDAPSGFSNSLKITTTTAETSIAADEYFYVAQFIEAQNLQQLSFGNSSAKSITLSFWAKSTQTGNFAVSLYTPDNAGMANSTYTINAASTWEYKTLTFTGDTSRAINNDNGTGMYVNFHLAAGTNFTSDPTDGNFEAYSDAKWAGGHTQNGVITTTNATWQITGVQLEVGDTATPFEHRSYGDELQRCMRFYYQDDTANHFLRSFYASAVGDWYEDYPLPVVMRATPTWTSQLGGDVSKVNAVSISGRTAKSGYVRFTVSSTGQGYCSLNTVTADAEL